MPLVPAHPAGLPLLIAPDGDASTDALVATLSTDPDTLSADLHRAGALLMRGWNVDSAEAFERVCRAIAPDLQNQYLGTSPRNALTPYTFTASELPPFYPIPQHNEMSFTKNPPSTLFFVCLTPNRPPGGETPLVDMRRVWSDLPVAVRERFSQQGLRFVRNYVGPGSTGWDPWKLKRWDEMFGTTDKATVEQRAISEGFVPEWFGDKLRLTNVQPAMKLHPVTGEAVWFNHSQVFHVDAAPAEYARIAARLGWKYHFWGGLASLLNGAKALVQTRSEAAMHCTYADGTEIAGPDMDAVREAIWKNLVAIPWQKGDVVAIDNHAVAHGRMPYAGERLIAVAWA